jgi:LEA14-like dessication related protein
MATREIRRLMLAVAAAAVLGGCSALGRQLFKRPGVTLRDVRLTGLGATGGNLDVALGVYNPNGYRLDATSLHYHLMVDTISVADGGLTDRHAFPGGDTTVVHLPVRFSYAGVMAAQRELQQTGAIEYHVDGDITVDSPVGSRTFPFKARGRFTTLNARIH